jgi:hypothetical protein
MSYSELSAWRTYLKGRIEQEKGNHTAAVAAFEAALRLDPTNPSFLKSLAISTATSPSDVSTAVSGLEAGYRKLAESLSGQDDDPKKWIAGLEKLVTDSDKAGGRGAAAVAQVMDVVW